MSTDAVAKRIQPVRPAPNVYDAEPIPEAARAEIDRLLASGDLFRYTAPEGAPAATAKGSSSATSASARTQPTPVRRS